MGKLNWTNCFDCTMPMLMPMPMVNSIKFSTQWMCVCVLFMRTLNCVVFWGGYNMMWCLIFPEQYILLLRSNETNSNNDNDGYGYTNNNYEGNGDGDDDNKTGDAHREWWHRSPMNYANAPLLLFYRSKKYGVCKHVCVCVCKAKQNKMRTIKLS